MALLIQREQNTTEYAWAFGSGRDMGSKAKLNAPGLTIDAEVRDSEFLGRLNEGTSVFIPREMLSMLEEIMRAAIDNAKIYPPETAGNQPPPPYYVRGVGMIGRSGNLTAGKESQNLKDRWAFGISPSEDGATGTVFNQATYGAFEQDEDWQAIWHHQHGWSTMQDLLRVQVDEAQRNPAAQAVAAAKDFVAEAAQNIVDFFNK